MEWPRIPVDRAVRDRTGGQKKVLRRDYLGEGRIPVIDQGKEMVAGYTNEEEAAYEGKLPVVLFGDHTRTFKYVDFPFALGADGVKVLEADPLFDAKFLYHCLSRVEIPGRGYSRHFKFLKVAEVPLPPLSEQRRIVEILDQADHLRRLRTEANTKAARILPALFLKMFGDPATNPMRWPIVELRRLGKPHSGGAFPRSEQGHEAGEVAFIKVSDMNLPGNGWEIRSANNWVAAATLDRLKVRPAPAGTTVFPKIGAAIATNKKRLLTRETAFDNNVIGVVPTHSDWSAYLFGFFQLFDLNALARSTAVPSIKSSELARLPIPKPERALARTFANHLRALSESKSAGECADNAIEGLRSALFQRAFSGDLTARWRAKHDWQLAREIDEQAKALQEAQ